MIRVEIYHKAGSLDTFREIRERLQNTKRKIEVNEHVVVGGNPYLGDQEVKICIVTQEPNEAGLKEGIIFLTDSPPGYKLLHEPQQLDRKTYLGIAEFSIRRPTLTEDIVKLVTSFDKSH